MAKKTEKSACSYSFTNPRDLEFPDTNTSNDAEDKQTPIALEDVTSIEDYAKNGRKSNTVIGEDAVVRFGAGFLARVSTNGCIYDQAHYRDLVSASLRDGVGANGFGYAASLPYAFILNDGTILENGEGGQARYTGHPTFSPTVLASLIAGKNCANVSSAKKVNAIVRTKNLKALDYTVAFSQPAPANIKKAYTKAKRDQDFSLAKFNNTWKKKAPQRGVTLVSEDGTVSRLRWHSSPTVLFQHGSRYYILGQDEGSYFGCELTGKPQTIAEALFVDLQPKEVRGKNGVLRQGEWFAVPEPKSAGHSMSKFYNNPKVVAILDSDRDSGIVMPKESADSNDHRVMATWGVILNDGTILAQDFSMYHDDHEDLNGKSGVWYKFYRNTAKASYSTQCVD